MFLLLVPRCSHASRTWEKRENKKNKNILARLVGRDYYSSCLPKPPGPHFQCTPAGGLAGFGHKEVTRESLPFFKLHEHALRARSFSRQGLRYEAPRFSALLAPPQHCRRSSKGRPGF